ncbi:TetR/AcrR family transcriptional regulator [Pseudonocardia ailaonensis]|uniref:TetR/AcrR family transcriptional regulator n=1 Tax=Pseudonocardia ailaonensis TaxID=367279 RepID=A0ABN2MHS1_9PSEU
MPPSRPQRADARRNRAALLAAAREAFLAGEEESHVEEIARRAGVAVGTLYRHFETREALVEEVYRREVDDLCAAAGTFLAQNPPEEALRLFLLLLVEHAAVGRGMAVALETIMVTDSPIFEDSRERMAGALDELIEAGTAAGTLRGGVGGRTLMRALGGICALRTAEGWQDEAVLITRVLFDGLRHGAVEAR